MSETDEGKQAAEDLRRLTAGLESAAAFMQRWLEAAAANRAAMDATIAASLALSAQVDQANENITEIALAIKGRLHRLDTAIADAERGFSINDDDPADGWKSGGDC